MQYAISYSRFSTGRQQYGSSLTRQLQQIDEYCRLHNLTLIESFHDAGKSGFHAKHLESGGQLRLLLDKVNDGTIPQGTKLLIEQTDRLTRQAVLEGLLIVQQLIFAGLVLVTLDDGQSYERNTDFGKLVLLLARLQRGHDESKAKSERLGFVWSGKAGEMKAGQLPKMRMPFWLTREGEDVIILSNWVSVIDEVFQSCIDGEGCAEIAIKLNKKGVYTNSGTNWTASSIVHLLRNKRLIGWHQRKESKELFKVYPPVMPIERFNDAQKALDTRLRSKGNTQKWSSALSGLARCGACGSVLKFSGKAPYRTGVCRAAVDGGSDCGNRKSLHYKALVLCVTVAVKSGVARKLMPVPSQQTADRDKLMHDIDSLDGQINNLIDMGKFASNVSEIGVQIAGLSKTREEMKQRLAVFELPLDGLTQKRHFHRLRTELVPELIEMVLEGNKDAASRLNILLHSLGGVEVTLLDGVATCGDCTVWRDKKTLRFNYDGVGSGVITNDPIPTVIKTIEFGTPVNPRSITVPVTVGGEELGGGYRLEYDEDAEPLDISEFYDEEGEIKLDKFTFMNS